MYQQDLSWGMNENLFIDYVLSFYGPNGIYASELDPPFTREECENALQKYLQIGIVDFEGDSVDRENLRDIVLISRGNEPWFGGYVDPSFLREQLQLLRAI